MTPTTPTRPVPMDAEAIALQDLPLFWQGRCNALRILDQSRGQSDHATLEQAWAYEECANELREALSRTALPGREKIARIVFANLPDDIEWNDHNASHVASFQIADAILALIPAQRDEGREDQSGWLIEKDDPPVYAILSDDYDEHWTSDARKALRFARKEDAEAYSDHIGWTSPPIRVAEHMWPSPPNETTGAEAVARLQAQPSSGSFLGYRNSEGAEMHCANAFCPHTDKCSKGCVNQIALATPPFPKPDTDTDTDTDTDAAGLAVRQDHPDFSSFHNRPTLSCSCGDVHASCTDPNCPWRNHPALGLTIT